MLTQSLSDANWQLRELTPSGRAKARPATVPGCVHTDLQVNELIPDPFYGRNEDHVSWIEEKEWTYFTEFELDRQLLTEQQVDLVFDGLDTLAVIRVNDSEIGRTENMFLGYRFNIKSHLKPGTNRIEIDFLNAMDYIRARHPGPLVPVSNDPVGGRQYIRKKQCDFGWDWGPRLVTAGIWQDVRLEAWSGNRLTGVHITQTHRRETVSVQVAPELYRPRSASRFLLNVNIYFDGTLVAEHSGPADQTVSLPIPDPQLWWTNDLGAQPLYTVEVTLSSDEKTLSSYRRRIGLCQIRLDQHRDRWGTSFQFTVNNIPIFAKGANWIPAHSFINAGRAHYDDLLTSAQEAHMNMIRVWGGGIYELEEFYDLCNAKGLLVWQDFMFACVLYPADRAFLRQVQEEATYQVRRLRNFSNLALWCGNNESEHMYHPVLEKNKQAMRDYKKIFYELLPATVQEHHPACAYWPSSGHNPRGPEHHPGNEDSGDHHYWGVWHSRAPVEAYEKQHHRFFSEFGMQAYPAPEVAATFTDDFNLYGPDMENHQKNGGGNATIMHYVSELYRYPADYRAAVYLSQLNQAYCMRFGIEHMRRNMPRIMGALYWQLNDCWPVASWSSIDFGGRWKALQYAARRFFAPALVSVKRLGEETMFTSANLIRSTIDRVELHTVCDGSTASSAKLSWGLYHVGTNRRVKHGRLNVKLKPGQARRQDTLDFSAEIEKYGRDSLILRTRLTDCDYPDSDNTTFLSRPKRVDFQQPKFSSDVKKISPTEFTVAIASDVIAYQVYLNLRDDHRYRASENFFDLFPGETRTITFRLEQCMTLSTFIKALTIYSYYDSYQPQ
jgi:beta-mannosidase